MKNRLAFHSAGERFFWPSFAASVLTLVLCACGGALSEDKDERLERFDGLVESLDAPSQRRARVLETIYNELRGPNGGEMRETLLESLSRPNSLILLGVTEALAMLGDPADVGSLGAFLATTDMMEVKTQVIRLLPAFCLRSERARFNYISYAAGYDRVPRAGVLEPLRRPPLTRRGRLDATLERLQGRVIRVLAAQFDPVGAALAYTDDLLYGAAARRTVSHYVGTALGNDPSRWPALWASQGGDMETNAPDEVEEIRLAALMSLADMGAEGIPEVIQAFGALRNSSDEVSRQAAFDAMSVMCGTAFEVNRALAAMSFGAAEAEEAENWRRRRQASTANLVLFAVESGERVLRGDPEAAVFTSAAACLGAALAFPEGIPDPDGDLAAARAGGLDLLETLLMLPDISRERRSAVALALGDIGTARAVAALAAIIESPYCAPRLGEDGARMAEACVDALRNLAAGERPGRSEARHALVELLGDARVYPPLRAGTPPVGLAHMVLWRLQRLARSNDVSLDPDLWRERLGW